MKTATICPSGILQIEPEWTPPSSASGVMDAGMGHVCIVINVGDVISAIFPFLISEAHAYVRNNEEHHT